MEARVGRMVPYVWSFPWFCVRKFLRHSSGLVTFQITYHRVQIPKNTINWSVLMFHDTLGWHKAQGKGTIE